MSIKRIHKMFVVAMWDSVCIASRIGNTDVLDHAVSKLMSLVPKFSELLDSLSKLFGNNDVRVVKAMRTHIMRTV